MINAWPEVTNLTADHREGGVLQAYGGEEIRNGMRTNAFVSNGLTGDSGSRVGGRIRFGAIEADTPPTTNWPNRAHAGFYYPGTMTSRIIYVADCRSGTCISSSSTGQNTHGGYVTKVLAGSIEAGQDPGVTNGVERRRRSGQASGSEVYYYLVTNSCSSWSAAVAEAVVQGIDIANISAYIGCNGSIGESPCWADCDCGGLNADLESAADNGVLVVSAHGNFYDPGVGTCNAIYPALRRSGLSASALNTPTVGTIYDTTSSSFYSSRGGMAIRLHTNTVIQDAFAVADLAAPGDHSYLYTTPPFGYDTTGTISGSSFAAPAVAGAAGMLREHFQSIGWGPNARVLLVNMILMGDSYAFDWGGDHRNGMDPRSGAGRTHMHYASATNLTSPWGWGWHTFNIGNSSTVSFSVWDAGPKSPFMRQWKVAMTWKETNYAAAADIVLEVWNTCPSGGGPAVLVAGDLSYDNRKRIELVQSEISNRCLEYRIRTFSNSMPVGQARTVYVADYFHSGNPADH